MICKKCNEEVEYLNFTEQVSHFGAKRYNNRMDKILAIEKESIRKQEELQNADHPARQFAISLIENVLEPTFGKYFRGEKYYHLEDAITMRISEILK